MIIRADNTQALVVEVARPEEGVAFRNCDVISIATLWHNIGIYAFFVLRASLSFPACSTKCYKIVFSLFHHFKVVYSVLF